MFIPQTPRGYRHNGLLMFLFFFLSRVRRFQCYKFNFLFFFSPVFLVSGGGVKIRTLFLCCWKYYPHSSIAEDRLSAYGFFKRLDFVRTMNTIGNIVKNKNVNKENCNFLCLWWGVVICVMLKQWSAQEFCMGPPPHKSIQLRM